MRQIEVQQDARGTITHRQMQETLAITRVGLNPGSNHISIPVALMREQLQLAKESAKRIFKGRVAAECDHLLKLQHGDNSRKVVTSDKDFQSTRNVNYKVNA